MRYFSSAITADGSTPIDDEVPDPYLLIFSTQKT
jgi:hypothetical protein